MRYIVIFLLAGVLAFFAVQYVGGWMGWFDHSEGNGENVRLTPQIPGSIRIIV